MQRLIDIDKKLHDLQNKMSELKPQYKKDEDIKNEYKTLKTEIKNLVSELERKASHGKDSELESNLILPTLYQALHQDLKTNAGSNVSEGMWNSIYDACTTTSLALAPYLK